MRAFLRRVGTPLLHRRPAPQPTCRSMRQPKCRLLRSHPRPAVTPHLRQPRRWMLPSRMLPQSRLRLGQSARSGRSHLPMARTALASRRASSMEATVTASASGRWDLPRFELARGLAYPTHAAESASTTAALAAVVCVARSPAAHSGSGQEPGACGGVPCRAATFFTCAARLRGRSLRRDLSGSRARQSPIAPLLRRSRHSRRRWMPRPARATAMATRT